MGTVSQTAEDLIDDRTCEQPDDSSHKIILALSIAILLLSFLLKIPNDQNVSIPGINFTLPGLCTFRQVLGIDCPGCGLTRSFISLAHGEFGRAWKFNPVGILFFSFLAFQIPYQTWQMWRIRKGQEPIEFGFWSSVPMIVIAMLLIIQWVIKLPSMFGI